MAVGIVVLVPIGRISTFFRGDGLTRNCGRISAAVGCRTTRCNARLRGLPQLHLRGRTRQRVRSASPANISRRPPRARGLSTTSPAVAITGDRATATMTYHFERSPEDKVTTPMVFTRDGEDWKVCSPGPGQLWDTQPRAMRETHHARGELAAARREPRRGAGGLPDRRRVALGRRAGPSGLGREVVFVEWNHGATGSTTTISCPT